MAIAYRSGSTAGNASSGDLTIDKPTGTADGDILVAVCYNELGASAWTPPAGWAQWGAGQANGSGNAWINVYWKRANGEGANYTFSISTTWRIISMGAFSGALESGDPKDVGPTGNNSNTSNQAIPLYLSIVTTVANTMRIGLEGNINGISDSVGSSGFSPGAALGGNEIWYVIQASSGASGDKQMGVSIGTNSWATFHTAIQPATGGGPVTITVAEGTQSQTGDAVTVSYSGPSIPFAYDAFSNQVTPGTGNLSWTHTPVSSTPAGVLVFVLQNAGTTDQVSGVTYGGSAMAEISPSPLLGNTTEGGVVYAYFLGSLVPTGAQTVAVTVTSGASTRTGGAISLTSGTTLQVINTGTVNLLSIGTPTGTIALGGTNAFVAEGIHAGPNAPSGITPFGGWTGQYEFDYGSQVAGVYTYDTIGTADVVWGWTQAADDAHSIVVAVAETPTTIITITVAEGTQAQAGDAVVVRGITGIVVAEGTQAQSGDAVTVAPYVPAVTLTVAEGTQAQAGDAVIVNGLTGLTIAEGTQSQTGDAVIINAITGLVVAKGTQAQSGDAVTVRGITGLVVAEGTQSQTGDPIVLNVIFNVNPAKGTQAQTGDAVTINGITALTVAEGNQAQTGDAVGVSFGVSVDVIVSEGNQAQSGDAVSLSTLMPLVVAEGTQSQTGDAVSISFGYSINLTVAEGNQSQAGDAVTLRGITALAIAEGNQLQTGDAVTLHGITALAIVEGTQAQTGDPVSLAFTSVIAPSEGNQSQTGDAITLRGITSLVVAEGMQTQTGSLAAVAMVAAIVFMGPGNKYINRAGADTTFDSDGGATSRAGGRGSVESKHDAPLRAGTRKTYKVQ